MTLIMGKDREKVACFVWWKGGCLERNSMFPTQDGFGGFHFIDTIHPSKHLGLYHHVSFPCTSSSRLSYAFPSSSIPRLPSSLTFVPKLIAIQLSSALATLSETPTAAVLEKLRVLERKTALVGTLLKASVYSIVLQQEVMEEG